jgi:N-acetylglucosaminyl-diphospho-decaprenol L-rhamnosyltransferase
MFEHEPSADDSGVTTTAPAQSAPAQARVLDLSVCIVNWNCRAALRNCLRSLHAQGLGLEYEIIVVDNASTDGAPDMVARQFPQVQLVRNATNAGFARANNQAARLARGKYVFFLNNDTIVPPEALRRLTTFLVAHPDVIMLGPRLRDARGKLQMSHRRRPSPSTFLHRTLLFRRLGLGRDDYEKYRRRAPGHDRMLDVDILMGAAVLMPRQPFLYLGGWDEDFTFGGEDMELCHRARRLGRIVYWPDVEITHLGSTSSKRHAAFAFPHVAVGFAKYFRKTGASRRALFGYKLAVTLDAPLRLGVRMLQYLAQFWRRSDRKSERWRREMRGSWAFMTRGLLAFWRA